MTDQNIWNGPLPELRKFLAELPAAGQPAHTTPNKIGGVPCQVVTPPDAESKKTVVYFHGGGFCLGLYPASVGFAAEIAGAAKMRVIAPDYRLAPEDPYPAALNDAAAVIEALYEEESELLLMGESSGCALLLSVLLQFKSEGKKLPSGLVLLTPMLDFAGQGESFATRAQLDPFQIKDPLWIANIYLSKNDPYSPVFSPLYGDLAGMPPMLIHAANNDVFLSDAQRLFQKALADGTNAELKVWPNMWHTFHLSGPDIPEAVKVINEITSFLHTV